LKNGVVCSDFAKEIGFEDGDKLISIDGEKVDVFYDIIGESTKSIYLEMMIYNDDVYIVVVDRGGRKEDVFIGANFIKHWKNSGRKPLFSPAIIVKIADFTKNSSSEKAGLLKGDILLSVNGAETKYFDELRAELQNHKSKTVEIAVLRNDTKLVFPVEVSAEGMIGFANSSGLEASIDSFGLASSFPAGYKLAMKELGGYIKGIGMIFNSDNDLHGDVGGFGAIGSMFPSDWSWERFWSLTAFLSLMLAFMNLLPIPALDGGHVVFLLYEIAVGKPAPDKVMEYAQGVGMILLLGLLVFANGNDILKLF
jgi:regulator of sigma E protease